MGILVTKASHNSDVHGSKVSIPGLLGMNIISQCYQELFMQHGPALFQSSAVQRTGVSTDPEKIRVVTEWRRPSTVKELWSFLGFASYYRCFVKGFVLLAAPLHRLVSALQGSRKQPRPRLQGTLGQHWDEACEESFLGLKSRLVCAPVLGYADFTRPFHVEIDASHAGLGAVLSQDTDGQRRPIAYTSHGLRPAERNMSNYSTMKLGLLALKWAVMEKFREYLLGNKFIVYTDNNPLSYLQSAELGAVEQQWASQLALFDFQLKYRPGAANRNADALSQLPAPPEPSSLGPRRWPIECLSPGVPTCWLSHWQWMQCPSVVRMIFGCCKLPTHVLPLS
ncbi:hypothetical protein MHYP_G00061870 [Metynnis hypsauchen]